MRIELTTDGGSKSYGGPMEAGIAMKPHRGNFMETAFMYAERGLMMYAMIRVALSDDFKDLVRNRF